MGERFLQTVVAIPLAVISYFAVSIIAGIVLFASQVAFTVIRPEIIGFGTNIMGCCLGVYAAQWCCNAVLRAYSHRTIFVAFAVLEAVMALIEYFRVSFTWHQPAIYAGLVATVIAAYVLFWQGDGVRHTADQVKA